MIAFKRERYVYLWRVKPAPIPYKGPNVTLADVLPIIRASYEANDAEIYFSDDGKALEPNSPGKKDRRNRIYIAAIDDQPDAVTFLINRGDPSVADPSFINSELSTVRIIAPKEHESPGFSAHLIIQKKADGNGIHRACFERMSHVPSSRVEILFRSILDRHAKDNPEYVFKKITKKGRKFVEEPTPYRPVLHVRRIPTERLENDLQEGVLEGITLIDNKSQFNGLDRYDDKIQSMKRKIVIRTKIENPDGVMDYIDGIKQWGRAKGFDEIQVHIADLPGGTSASPRFNLQLEDASETLYVRSQRIDGFPIVLENCYGSICPEIQVKMLTLVNDEGKW